MDDDLVVEHDGTTATLIINRPDQRNAISFEMFRRLPDRLAELAADPRVKALVVRGAGRRAFAAGADISEFRTVRANSAGARAYNAAVAAAERALSTFPRPTIAMVHGYCIGGGCGLALCCDMRLADTAAAFGITPAKLGLVYSLESTKRLMDVVGPAATRLMLYSGRHLTAEHALRIGLVDELHEPDDLSTAVHRLATDIGRRAPISVTRAKQIVQLVLNGQHVEDEHSTLLRDSSFDSADYAEGVQAFLEKRAPEFTGC